MHFLILGYCLFATACAASEGRGASVGANTAGSLESAIALAETPAAEARRIWAGGDADGTGGPSPDGTLMTYVDWAALTLNVRNVKTGEVRVLAKPAAGTNQFPEYSRFSPDGRQVVYSWFNGEGGELRMVGAQGGEPRVVLARNPDVRWSTPLGWTPNGESVLARLVRADGSVQLSVVNVSTGALRTLRTYRWEQAPTGGVATSPDGKLIATGERSGKDLKEQVIVVAALSGGSQTEVVKSPGVNNVIGWANDGRLFYSTERDGAGSVYAMPMRDGRPGGAPVLMKTDFQRAFPMALTDDGRLFYSEFTGTLDVYVAGIDPVTMQVTSSPTRASHRLIGINQGLDWTQDGRQAAYLIRKGFVPASAAILAIRDEKTGEVRELEPALGYINPAMRWSPDGSRIAAQGSDSKGRTGLQLIDPRTGQIQTLFRVNPKGGMVQRPMWSPDGKSLFYALADVDGSSEFRVMRRDLATGVQSDVYGPLTGSTLYSLSPDGRNIAVAVNSGESMTLSIVPVSGGAPKLLATVPVKEPIATVEFSRDGRHLLYGRVTDSKTQATDVWSVAVSGGEPRPVGLSMKSLRGLRMHPDGRRLGFSGGETSTEIWVLESSGSRQLGAIQGDRR